MAVRVLNVDVLDDHEPTILVQRYWTAARSYIVFRKPTNGGEHFEVSSGVEIDPDQYWAISPWLADPSVLGDDESAGPEVFAEVYLDEDNAPVYDPDELDAGDPYASIVYDPKAQVYRAEATFIGYEPIAEIAAASIDEALERVVVALDPLVDREEA